MGSGRKQKGEIGHDERAMEGEKERWKVKKSDGR
jgi:hypothetical protein